MEVLSHIALTSVYMDADEFHTHKQIHLLEFAKEKPLGSFHELVGMSEVISKRFSALAHTQAVYIVRVKECGVPLASQNPH